MSFTPLLDLRAGGRGFAIPARLESCDPEIISYTRRLYIFKLYRVISPQIRRLKLAWSKTSVDSDRSVMIDHSSFEFPSFSITFSNFEDSMNSTSSKLIFDRTRSFPEFTVGRHSPRYLFNKHCASRQLQESFKRSTAAQ